MRPRSALADRYVSALAPEPVWALAPERGSADALAPAISGGDAEVVVETVDAEGFA